MTLGGLGLQLGSMHLVLWRAMFGWRPSSRLEAITTMARTPIIRWRPSLLVTRSY